MIITVAPAKINWILAVLVRRYVGDHDARPVRQTVALCVDRSCGEAERLTTARTLV